MSNIINVLRAGNREQFHSSFFAWLMSQDESHGFQRSFQETFLEKAGEDTKLEYDVYTEYSEGGNRYDILLKNNNKKIAIENKTKSLGYNSQLIKYDNKVDKVLLISLLKENFSNLNNYIHFSYLDIVSIIEEKQPDFKYASLINDYCEYVKVVSGVFSGLNKYCLGESSYQDLCEKYDTYKTITSENENDKRFLQNYFYYVFSNYLKEYKKELIFGSTGYRNKNNPTNATKWIREKDMQGSSFMESLVYSPELEFMHLNDELNEFYKKFSFTIAPRLEINISVNRLTKGEDHIIGEFLIGTWTKELHEFFRKNTPYKDSFVRKGRRNFHVISLSVQDLKFENLSNIIKENLMKIYVFK